MRIIVQNEKEAELMERLVMDMDAYGLDEYVKLDAIDGEGISKNDSLFLQYAFTAAKIEVDTAVEAMYCCSDIVTGKCCKCGVATSGVVDEAEITYEEYLAYEKARKDDALYCADCL